MPRDRKRVILDTGSVSRTKQADVKGCDINLIVKRHAQTGMWDHLNPQAPHYGDFTASVDLQEAFHLVETAQAEFDALPPEVRAVVENDPVKFSEALSDPELFRDLVEAGMPATEEPQQPAPIVGGETPEEPNTSQPT